MKIQAQSSRGIQYKTLSQITEDWLHPILKDRNALGSLHMQLVRGCLKNNPVLATAYQSIMDEAQQTSPDTIVFGSVKVGNSYVAVEPVGITYLLQILTMLHSRVNTRNIADAVTIMMTLKRESAKYIIQSGSSYSDDSIYLDIPALPKQKDVDNQWSLGYFQFHPSTIASLLDIKQSSIASDASRLTVAESPFFVQVGYLQSLISEVTRITARRYTEMRNKMVSGMMFRDLPNYKPLSAAYNIKWLATETILAEDNSLSLLTHIRPPLDDFMINLIYEWLPNDVSSELTRRKEKKIWSGIHSDPEMMRMLSQIFFLTPGDPANTLAATLDDSILSFYEKFGGDEEVRDLIDRYILLSNDSPSVRQSERMFAYNAAVAKESDASDYADALIKAYNPVLISTKSRDNPASDTNSLKKGIGSHGRPGRFTIAEAQLSHNLIQSYVRTLSNLLVYPSAISHIEDKTTDMIVDFSFGDDDTETI